MITALGSNFPLQKRRITNGQGADSTVQAVVLNTARVKTSGSGECNGGHSDKPKNSEIAAGSTVAESPVMLNPKTPSCEGCPSNRVVPSINLCGFLETACSQDPFAKSQFQQRSDSTVQAVMLNKAKVKTSPYWRMQWWSPKVQKSNRCTSLCTQGFRKRKLSTNQIA